MWRCDNVGGLGEHVTCHLFDCLVYLFWLYSSARASPHEWIDFDDLYVVYTHKDVPFGVTVILLPHFEGQIPPKKTLFLGRE